MRIAHLKNPANLAWRLAQGQKQLGHEAIVYSRGDQYGFPYDVLMPSGARWNLWMLKKLSELATFDVLHIHGGVWRGEVAYQALRLTKIPVFIQFNGGEARRGGGLHWMSIADGTFYTDPDIAKFLPSNGKWIPQPIDLEVIRPAPEPENEKPVFVHFESSQKGAAKIEKMFKQAFKADEAELRMYYQVPHGVVLNAIRASDVVIDQITPLGIYGYVSVEAMALGKPVLATLDHGLYPADCPVIYPHATKLMELAKDAEARRWYGARGREYVERVHDARKVAAKVLDVYETANL